MSDEPVYEFIKGQGWVPRKRTAFADVSALASSVSSASPLLWLSMEEFKRRVREETCRDIYFIAPSHILSYQLLNSSETLYIRYSEGIRGQESANRNRLAAIESLYREAARRGF